MPALQFEAGQQNGGDVFCWSCPIKANLCPNISYSYSLPYISLQDRTTKKGCIKTKQSCSTSFTIKYLQELLTNEVHGIQRLPALN